MFSFSIDATSNFNFSFYFCQIWRHQLSTDSDHGSISWGASNKAQELQEDKELKRSRKREKTRAEGVEKRVKTTIINGFNLKRCTPSYRPRLTDEFPAPNAAASTSKEAPILNDYWVSEPCPDTRSSTKPKKEITLKDPEDDYEDKRYESDMDLASLKSAIDNAEKLQNHIEEIGRELLDLETPIRLANYFTASNIKLICDERYGRRITERLRRKPAVALPVVLAGLNEKKEEVLKSISGLRVGL
ncbi:hypothetical protein FNV43_RR01239 [Rhamnella rubrinervis]|uniref:Histone deacetylase interacting domain-containing protein n=1 Tax=Rhamnella rubrinervis TaxID=2594499 RepID=A0A8K0HRY4_9ROSA|nr:hypothetical protein FNV43_RR01239 [Rhamnella rubrinervis]